MSTPILLSTVGEDFTTLTGKEVIPVVFEKGSAVASVDVLIRDDALVEDNEWFTAEFHSESHMQNTSATIYIEDTHTVLYTFQQPAEFHVNESNGTVTVRLSSSEPIPSDVNVDVDVIEGVGNAFGK